MHARTETESRAKTRFLSPEDVGKIIARKGIAECLGGMAAYIHEDFLRWNAFDKRARAASHSPGGVIELMSIADERTYAFKYVNGHPANFRHDLPTVMAFGVLADVDTGVPMLVSELTLTTALRTAATSIVAARALARADSTTMALIGNGAQSEFQPLAFHHLMGIEDFHLFDTDGAATEKLMRNLRSAGVRSKRFANARDAVRGVDIVSTLTADKAHATILTPDMIEPGMHVNAVGGDCPGKTELHADVLRMATVVVEYETQSRIEGDIQQMPAGFSVTELWQVLAGNAAGRTDATQVTVFDSVGFALEDYSALRFMRDMANELGISASISLIPRLPDPKDLFGFIQNAGDRGTRAEGANAALSLAR